MTAMTGTGTICDRDYFRFCTECVQGRPAPSHILKQKREKTIAINQILLS